MNSQSRTYVATVRYTGDKFYSALKVSTHNAIAILIALVICVIHPPSMPARLTFPRREFGYQNEVKQSFQGTCFQHAVELAALCRGARIKTLYFASYMCSM